MRFHIEDELLNEELTTNLPIWMRWNAEYEGNTTAVEYVDDYTTKFTFAMPYGAFINRHFRDNSWNGWADWLAPSHFLKPYHKAYGDMDEILAMMEEMEFPEEEQWANFYNSLNGVAVHDAGSYFDHPLAAEIPVLFPWVVKEVYEDGSTLYERNPYFFAVDPEGNQLPYLDYMKRQFVADSELTNLDIIAGNVDLQTIYIQISDFPLYKENEEQGNYNALPKKAWQHHVLIYWLNISIDDEQLGAALRELDFRKALSMALDREFINESVFLGLGTPAQFAPPNGTPIYSEELANYAAEYDPEGAMALLDGLGYVDVDGDGWREDPEGNDFLFPVSYYEVTPVANPGAQILEEYWEAVGINTDVKQMDGGTFWQYQGANTVAAAIWWANGPDFGDGPFIAGAVSQKGWDIWRNTDGEEGVEPPDWQKRIWEIQDERMMVATDDERWELDAEGWDLLTKNLSIIGTVEGPKNPLILNKGIGNIEYGLDKDFTNVTFLDWSFQWYYTDPAQREVNP
jgi:peptide/nickel transport system substrate-binding protein